MTTGFTFNGGHTSAYNLMALNIKRSFHAPVSPRLITAPGKAGAYNFNDPDVDMLVFDVQVLMLERGNREYHETRRRIAQWLFTGEEKPLVFDDEPDKTYLAMLSGDTNIDRVGSSGTATITFVCSDPYARGETKTQRIANPGMVFRRDGVRYRDDGTIVTGNYPVFKVGKFGQAVVIEEGTTNILKTASYPARETVTVREGEDYYLSTVNGYGEVRQQKTQVIGETNRRLAKAGRDVSMLVNNETVGESDREIKGVAYSSTDEGTYTLATEIKQHRSYADFGKQTIDPSISLQNPSDYDMTPPGSGGDLGTTPPTHGMAYTSDRAYEQSSYSMSSPQLGAGETSTIKLSYSFPSWSRDRRIAYRAYMEGENTGGLYGNILRFTTPGLGAWEALRSTSDNYNNWVHYYIPASIQDKLKTGTNHFYMGYRRGEQENAFRGFIDHVFFEYKYDGYVAEGFAEFNVSLDGVKDLASAEIRAKVSTPSGTNVSFEVDTDGSGYVPYVLGDPLSGLEPGSDLDGKIIKLKVTLRTSNDRITPTVSGIKLDVKSGYVSPKTVTLPFTDVSSIKVAKSSSLVVHPSIPANTTIQFERSIDGGETWETIVPGGTIVDAGTNLDGKRLALRYTLSSTDRAVSPDVGDLVVWKIEQENPNKIVAATTELELTPIGVSRWQLENRAYPTGWNPTGSRNPESMYTLITDSLKGGKGTIGLWAYEDGFESLSPRRILETDGGGDLLFYRSPDGKHIARFNNETTIEATTPETGWHYWAVRWDGQNIDLFLDGELAASAKLPSELILDYAERLYVGCSASGSEQFNSLIDDLAIYSTALTDTEIAAVYNSGVPVEATGESVVFPFDNSLYPQGSSAIEVDGTAPTPAVFRVSFSAATDYFKISNGYEYILINTSFEAGDVLEIDCEKHVVKKNGVPRLAMPYLSRDSDFFDLVPGGSVTVEPARLTKVDATFTERWR